MKNILFAAAALSALAAAPAMAQSVGTVTMNGSVTESCSVTDATTVVQLGDIAAQATDVDDVLAAATSEVTCNGAGTDLTIELTRVSNQDVPELPAGAAEAGFGNYLNYEVQIKLADGYADGITNDSTGVLGGDFNNGVSSSSWNGSDTWDLGLTRGTLQIDLIRFDTDGRDILVAGAYEGSVTVSVTPGV